MKKRISQYQYEPLVTPAKWAGEELRFSQRLTQILDDLYAKYSALKENGQANLENAEESFAEKLEQLSQSVEAVGTAADDHAQQIGTMSGKVAELETTCADLQMKTFSCGAAKKLTLKFTHAPYGGCAVFVRSSARSALMLVAVNGTSATPTTASNVNNITLPTVAFTSSTNTLTITAATGVHMGVMLYGQVNDTLASATITNAA